MRDIMLVEVSVLVVVRWMFVGMKLRLGGGRCSEVVVVVVRFYSSCRSESGSG